MAVYTKVSEYDLKQFLLSYDIGLLVRFEGIEQGVSNTNYHVFTDHGRYILTLFEPHRVHAEDIPYYVDYTVVLEREGVPVPITLPRKDGSVLGMLSDRPAAIYSFLQGEGGHAGMLNADLCGKAGAVLGKMHLAGAKIQKTAANHFGLTRWRDWVHAMGADMNTIKDGMQKFVEDELEWISARYPSSLPSGAIHADFFPDNVFFESGEITGVIDFHFVCHDLFAYDLAIAINAWCFDQENNFDDMRMQAMVDSYNAVRPLSAEENEAMPVLLRAASLRFLTSRLEEKLAWTPEKIMRPHDPLVFEKRLRYFQQRLGA